MNAFKAKGNKEVPCFLDAPETLLLALERRRMSQTRSTQPNESMGQTEESEQMTHNSSRFSTPGTASLYVKTYVYTNCMC